MALDTNRPQDFRRVTLPAGEAHARIERAKAGRMAALRAEREELQAANDAAPGGGAAVGARAERISAINSTLVALAE